MSGFSDAFETQVLNVLRGITLTAPATVYVGLYTTTPSEAGGGTEVSGGSYARQVVTFGAPTGGQISNTVAINFPAASANWGTVTTAGIFDAATGGNLLAFNALAVSQAVTTGNQVAIGIGQLTISLD